MFNQGEGCGVLVAGLAICVALLVIGFLLVMPLLENLNDAEAQRLHAEAALTRARTDLEAQRQVNWEHSYMMWTTTLAVFSHDPLTWVLLLLLVVGLVVVVYWLLKAWQPAV